MDIPKIRYVVFPGQDPTPAWKSVYEEAYRCWKSVWSETFRELDGAEKVYSDDFTRQSHIGAVMIGSRCVAVVFIRLADFSVSTAKDDSYFKVWPEQAITQLISQGKIVTIGSHITVDPEFRGVLVQGVKLKSLLLGLAIEQTLALGADVMTGTLRCNRGMTKSGEDYDATPIGHAIHHGVEVDIVAFFSRRIRASGTLDSHPEVRRLWNARTDYAHLAQNLKKVA